MTTGTDTEMPSLPRSKALNHFADPPLVLMQSLLLKRLEPWSVGVRAAGGVRSAGDSRRRGYAT